MTVERCPHCRQPVPERKPACVCFDCKLPMSNHHKWTLQERNGVPTPVHRNCEDPTKYQTVKEE
jgi:hypothetical protein